MKSYSTANLLQIEAQELVNKTIVNIDAYACNVLLLELDDGRTIAIECNPGVAGLATYKICKLVN